MYACLCCTLILYTSFIIVITVCLTQSIKSNVIGDCIRAINFGSFTHKDLSIVDYVKLVISVLQELFPTQKTAGSYFNVENWSKRSDMLHLFRGILYTSFFGIQNPFIILSGVSLKKSLKTAVYAFWSKWLLSSLFKVTTVKNRKCWEFKHGFLLVLMLRGSLLLSPLK